MLPPLCRVVGARTVAPLRRPVHGTRVPSLRWHTRVRTGTRRVTLSRIISCWFRTVRVAFA